MDWNKVIENEREQYDLESWRNFVRHRLISMRSIIAEMKTDLANGEKELAAWEMEAVHINLDGALFSHE